MHLFQFVPGFVAPPVRFLRCTILHAEYTRKRDEQLLHVKHTVVSSGALGFVCLCSERLRGLLSSFGRRILECHVMVHLCCENRGTHSVEACREDRSGPHGQQKGEGSVAADVAVNCESRGLRCESRQD